MSGDQMPPDVARDLERARAWSPTPTPAPAPAPLAIEPDEVHPFAPGGAADEAFDAVLVDLAAYQRERERGRAPRERTPAPPPAPPQRAFAPRTGADIARPLPPIPWLCRQLGIAPGRPVIISGYGGVGKTFAVQALALAVASGARRLWDCYDLQLDGPQRVLHLDGEQGQWITDWRYQRLAWSMGIDIAQLGERLGALHYPELFLTDPSAEALLAGLCAGVRLCIIDSLRAFTPGADENDSQISQYLYLLARVSERTGCVFVVVAHEGKTSGENPRTGIERLRGSSAIAAAAGTVVSFVRAAEEGCVRIEHTRANLGSPARDEVVRLVDEGDIDPMTEKTCGLRIEWMPREQAQAEQAQAEDARRERMLRDVASRVLAIVAARGAGGVTGAKAIEKIVAVKRDTLHAAWAMLAAEGVIANAGGAGRAARWVVAARPARVEGDAGDAGDE